MKVTLKTWLIQTALAAAVAQTSAIPIARGAQEEGMLLLATCGDLRGYRVDMDPVDPARPAQWRSEHYREGPPPEGRGTLEFVADDGHPDLIGVRWGAGARFLPVAYASDTQISLADVDDFGVWMFSLYPQAGKVVVSRQTAGPGPAAVGALVQGDCKFRGG